MKAGWQIAKLGEVCSFLNRGVSPNYIDQGGICVLNQKCVRDHRINYEESRRHDPSAKHANPERFIQLGDVLVNSTGTGTLGRVAQIRERPPEPTIVDSHITIVRPKTKMFFPDFFGYMLVLIEEAIKDSGEGCGGQTELSRSVLAEKFKVSYPISISEQHRIVAILDEAFAGIATATANAERNLNNAREVFDSTVQSKLDNENKVWSSARLGDVCSIARGGSPRPIERFLTSKPDGVNWIKIGDATGGGKYIYKTAQKIRPEGAKRSRIVHEGDFLLSNSMSFGHPYILRTSGCIHDGWLVLSDYDKHLNQDYLYHLLGSKLVFSQFDRLAAGSTVRNLNIELASRVTIPVPSLEEQRKIAIGFERLLVEVDHLQATYTQKLTALNELKQSILHQAFSGQLH